MFQLTQCFTNFFWPRPIFFFYGAKDLGINRGPETLCLWLWCVQIVIQIIAQVCNLFCFPPVWWRVKIWYLWRWWSLLWTETIEIMVSVAIHLWNIFLVTSQCNAMKQNFFCIFTIFAATQVIFFWDPVPGHAHTLGNAGLVWTANLLVSQYPFQNPCRCSLRTSSGQ